MRLDLTSRAYREGRVAAALIFDGKKSSQYVRKLNPYTVPFDIGYAACEDKETWANNPKLLELYEDLWEWRRGFNNGVYEIARLLGIPQ